MENNRFKFCEEVGYRCPRCGDLLIEVESDDPCFPFLKCGACTEEFESLESKIESLNSVINYNIEARKDDKEVMDSYLRNIRELSESNDSLRTMYENVSKLYRDLQDHLKALLF